MTGPWTTSPVLPGADEVHVFRVDLDPAPPFARPGDLLSAEEQAKAARFAFARDRRRYALSHRALRSVLGGYLSCDPRDVCIAERPGHKPRLVGVSDLRFNLSHSGEQALIGVTRGREIGIDLEQLRDLDDPGLLAARCFAPSELVSWQKLPERVRKAGFFATWTRKEAYLKARGDGLARPLDSFEVEVAPSGRPFLSCDALDREAVSHWSFADLDAGPGYAAALAVEGDLARVLCFDVVAEEEHGSRGAAGGGTSQSRREPGAAVLAVARGQDPAVRVEGHGLFGLASGVPGPHPGGLDRYASGDGAHFEERSGSAAGIASTLLRAAGGCS